MAPLRLGAPDALAPAGLVTFAALLTVLVAVGTVGAAVIAQARVLGLAAWLSQCSSTTTRAPRAA